MPKLRKLANRTKELEIFLKMAQGKHDCRIMLIEGASGMGKSSLLSRFGQKCPSEVKYVPFDCKGLNSIAAFLSEVVTDLGRAQFPSFVKQVKLFSQGSIDFSENDIEADKISIAINGSNLDKQAQEHRLQQLHNAFFEDLSKLEDRIVIVLDTFQDANPELQSWVEHTWLRTVERRLKNIATVIAGQSIPDPNNAVWGNECEHFPLTHILDIDYWYDFCPHLSKDTIKTILLLTEGHPLQFHQSLSMVEKNW